MKSKSMGRSKEMEVIEKYRDCSLSEEEEEDEYKVGLEIYESSDDEDEAQGSDDSVDEIGEKLQETHLIERAPMKVEKNHNFVQPYTCRNPQPVQPQTKNSDFHFVYSHADFKLILDSLGDGTENLNLFSNGNILTNIPQQTNLGYPSENVSTNISHIDITQNNFSAETLYEKQNETYDTNDCLTFHKLRPESISTSPASSDSQFYLNPSPQSEDSNGTTDTRSPRSEDFNYVTDTSGDLDDSQLPTTLNDLKIHKTAKAQIREIIDQNPKYKDKVWVDVTLVPMKTLLESAGGLNYFQRMAKLSKIELTEFYAYTEKLLRNATRDTVIDIFTREPTVHELLRTRKETLLSKYVEEILENLGCNTTQAVLNEPYDYCLDLLNFDQLNSYFNNNSSDKDLNLPVIRVDSYDTVPSASS